MTLAQKIAFMALKKPYNIMCSYLKSVKTRTKRNNLKMPRMRKAAKDGTSPTMLANARPHKSPNTTNTYK